MNSMDMLLDRQYGDVELEVQNRLQTAPHLMDRIELEVILEGHNGCVNCLEWSDDGRYLASGSDDFHVMIWDPFRRKSLNEVSPVYSGKCIEDLKTPHTGNIFSVKFLPKSGNSIMATGAGDKCIFVFDLNRNSDPIWNCICHRLRVKRLATAVETPFIFWSVGEDGNVLQFDIREHHKCRSDDKVLLINLGNYLEGKCIAINPRRPELLAVGASDAYARLYDRRKIKLEKIETSKSSRELPKDCVTYFCPGHFSRNTTFSSYDSKAITYLTFNSDGNELLVNMGAEHIYLYDIDNAQQPVFLDLPEYRKPTDESTAEPSRTKRKLPEHVEIYKKRGNDFLENEKYLMAIDQYTQAIQMAPDCPILYLNRATALMRRLWYGDVYAALRDCHIALKLDPSYIKAHFRLARALHDLGRIQEAEMCLKELIARFPNYANNHGVLVLRKEIQMSAENKKNEQSDSFTLLDLSKTEEELRSKAKDYKERFIGHCNTTTDIKEATFFGNDSKYIVAGSDDCNFFIWERPTNMIKSIYKGDMAIVNCVQPHPTTCLLATSGIDHEIKIWSPLARINEERSNRVQYIEGTIDLNQKKMKSDPFDINAPSTYCRSS